jgi:hypothetical protein
MSAKKSVSVIALAITILLSACGGAPAAPTVDANAVYTQAASTVQAQLTQTALAMPTATATATVQPTEQPTDAPAADTPAGSDIQAPTMQITAVTLTPEGAQVVPSLTPVLGSAPTAGAGGQKVGDHATFAFNNPADGASFAKGQKFTMELGLINSGSVTWSEQYKMVFVGGQYLCYQTSVLIDAKKAPGEKGIFDFACYAPDKVGKYKSTWKLKNSAGQFVPGGEIYFSYTVN